MNREIQLLHFCPLPKQGEINKLSHYSTTIINKKRYFVLCNGSINYYAKVQKSQQFPLGLQLKGQIGDLLDYSIVIESNNVTLLSPEDGSKHIILEIPDFMERKVWVDALQTHIKYAKARQSFFLAETPSPAPFRGKIKKKGHENIFSWKDRYLLATNGGLFYYSDEGETAMKGEISNLAGYELSVLEAQNNLFTLRPIENLECTTDLVFEVRDSVQKTQWEGALRQHIQYANTLHSKRNSTKFRSLNKNKYTNRNALTNSIPPSPSPSPLSFSPLSPQEDQEPRFIRLQGARPLPLSHDSEDASSELDFYLYFVRSISESDFQNLKYRSHVANRFGDRWFLGSGAANLQRTSQMGYTAYLDPESDSLYERDIDQVDKDVISGRSDFSVFEDEKLIQFLSPSVHMPDLDHSHLGGEVKFIYVEEKQLEIRQTLRRILISFSKRNRPNGYTQGLSLLTYVLLGFMEEEQVFWTLCAIVDHLRLPDFYSPPPAPMNGYQIELKVITELLSLSFPQLFTDLETTNQILMAIELLSPKIFISFTIDFLPWESTVVALDNFFIRGELGFFMVWCAIMSQSFGQLQSLSRPSDDESDINFQSSNTSPAIPTSIDTREKNDVKNEFVPKTAFSIMKQTAQNMSAYDLSSSCILTPSDQLSALTELSSSSSFDPDLAKCKCCGEWVSRDMKLIEQHFDLCKSSLSPQGVSTSTQSHSLTSSISLPSFPNITPILPISSLSWVYQVVTGSSGGVAGRSSSSSSSSSTNIENNNVNSAGGSESNIKSELGWGIKSEARSLPATETEKYTKTEKDSTTISLKLGKKQIFKLSPVTAFILGNLYSNNHDCLLLLQSFRDFARENISARWISPSPSVLNGLSKRTIFSVNELQILQQKFKELIAGSGSDVGSGINKALFVDVMSDAMPNFDPYLLGRFFEIFDTNKSDSLNFQEFVCLLSVLCNVDSPEEKIKLCFDSFDTDRNGFLDGTELNLMSRTLKKLMDLSNSQHRSFSRRIQLLDTNGDGQVSIAQFIEGMKNESKLFEIFQLEKSYTIEGIFLSPRPTPSFFVSTLQRVSSIRRIRSQPRSLNCEAEDPLDGSRGDGSDERDREMEKSGGAQKRREVSERNLLKYQQSPNEGVTAMIVKQIENFESQDLSDEGNIPDGSLKLVQTTLTLIPTPTPTQGLK